MRLVDSASYFTNDQPTKSVEKGAGARELTDDDLRTLYRYPAALRDPWVRVNFVSSVDGAVSVAGVSGGLSSDGDKRLFGILRELADVILVGSGTARAEGYRGARTSAARQARRLERGQGPVPPIAVVTATANLDPASRLLTDTAAAPLILTTRSAPQGKKSALSDAGADVLEIGTDAITPGQIRDALAERGLLRVLCEGGPSLFGDLIAADAVSELCLTTAPVLTAGDSGRISRSPGAATVALRRAHLLDEADGTLFARWVRRDGAPTPDRV